MPVKKRTTSALKKRASVAKRSVKKVKGSTRRPRSPSKRTGGSSPAKIHQGVGLERGASRPGGLTSAAEKIGAAIGTAVGLMDKAVHSAAVFGEREMATVGHEVGLLQKRLSTREPNRRRTRPVPPRKVVPK